MGTRYNIAVTATDAATARVRAIKKSLASIVSPITEIGKSVKSLGKEIGVDKLAKGVKSLASDAAGAIKSISGISPALAGVIGLGGLSAFLTYSKQLANAQSATLRFSQTTGVAADRVQVMEGAARLAGLQAGDMDGAIQSLGTTLQDARWGRNQGALMMMNRLGMGLKYTKKGAIDTEASLGDLADIMGPGGKLANAPVQTKLLVAQQFGVEALLPILLKGRKGWEDYEKAAAKAKPPLSTEDLKRADQYRQDIDNLTLSFEGLGQAIQARAMPGLDAVARWVAAGNKQAAENIAKKGFWGALGSGINIRVGDAFNGALNLGRKVPESIKEIGNLIGAGEGGYDSVNTGKKGGYKSGRVNLIESSIQAVMDAQNRGEFNAAGKYQVTRDTLRAAVTALHLDTSQKFDQGTQDRIFKDYLIAMRRPQIADYISGKSSDLKGAVKAASEEWASIADPDTGKSHYAGVAGNRSSISADDFASALKGARQGAAHPAEKAKRYIMGQDNGGMEGVWKGGQKAAKIDGSITVELKGLPAGASATVTETAGPLKTTLKTETSMPDYNL